MLPSGRKEPIEQRIGDAITGLIRQNSINEVQITELKDMSSKYRISDLSNLLQDYFVEVLGGESDEVVNINKFKRCVSEFVYRYNENDWQFLK
ncbi:hypothetical protein St703_27240 [Sporolactobacillus terrae]|uniref:Uncharacterized protein n=1 Tax=Sporolactobacillus terrae TaxID=269673 RepID=A0A5K7X1W0_9BACL|nr:hypothetical protein St703_27240 [Sporolactobacillus terrae]